MANTGTKLRVDPESRTVEIISSNGEYRLKTDELKRVERVIYGDYMHPAWQQSFFPIPWRNYGYLRIIIKDDKVFLLTSLLLNPLRPPIEQTVTKYRFIPSLDERVKEEPTIEKLGEYQRKEVKAFKAKFKNQTEEELKKKTSSNGVRKEAVLIDHELLVERTRGDFNS